jgi:ribosomal protein S14
MFNWIYKDQNVRTKICKVELRKKILKSLLSSTFFDFSDKIFFFRLFQRYNFQSSISFQRTSCLFTGRAKSVFRMFKLYRHQAKAFASNGLIGGLRKSSF